MGFWCPGLCHISQVSDTFTKDLSTLFKANQKVVTKITAIDAGTKKISLTMKASALNGKFFFFNCKIIKSLGISGRVS